MPKVYSSGRGSDAKSPDKDVSKKAKKISEKKGFKAKAKTQISEVKEPIVLYKKRVSGGKSKTVGLISGITGSTKSEWKMTASEKMSMVRDGISKEKFEQLKARTMLDYDKLSTILATTRATLINKKGRELFSSSLSERIISIAELYSYGYEVFENESSFNEWIFKPNRSLGGKSPFVLLDNQFGREEVKNLIGRIDYGVYS